MLVRALCCNNDTKAVHAVHNWTEKLYTPDTSLGTTRRMAGSPQSCHHHFSRNISHSNDGWIDIQIYAHTHKYIISTKYAYSRPQILLILSQ
jgi:hypothetical protein